MADNKDKLKEKPSKELAKKNDDTFNVVNLIAKVDPPKPSK